jgi:hypothetical protein
MTSVGRSSSLTCRRARRALPGSRKDSEARHGRVPRSLSTTQVTSVPATACPTGMGGRASGTGSTQLGNVEPDPPNVAATTQRFSEVRHTRLPKGNEGASPSRPRPIVPSRRAAGQESSPHRRLHAARNGRTRQAANAEWGSRNSAAVHPSAPTGSGKREHTTRGTPVGLVPDAAHVPLSTDGRSASGMPPPCLSLLTMRQTGGKKYADPRRRLTPQSAVFPSDDF